MLRFSILHVQLFLLTTPTAAVRGPPPEATPEVANGVAPVTRQLITATYEGLRSGGPGGDVACFVARGSLDYTRVGRNAPPEVKVNAGVEACVQLETQSVALQTMLRALTVGTQVKMGWDYEGSAVQRRVTLLVAEGKRTPVDHQSIFGTYLGPTAAHLVSFNVTKSLEYEVYGTQPRATIEPGLKYTLDPKNMSAKFQATLKHLAVGTPVTLTWDDCFVENERYENGQVVRETNYEHTTELFLVVTEVKRELLAAQVATATYAGVKGSTTAGVSDETESTTAGAPDEMESTAAGVFDGKGSTAAGVSAETESTAAGASAKTESTAAGTPAETESTTVGAPAETESTAASAPAETETTASGTPAETESTAVGVSDGSAAAGVSSENSEICFNIIESRGFVQASQGAEAEVKAGEQFCTLPGFSGAKTQRALLSLSKGKRLGAPVVLGWTQTMVTYEVRSGDGSVKTHSKLERPVILLRQGAEVDRSPGDYKKITAIYVGHIRQTETGDFDKSQQCFEVASSYVASGAHLIECFKVNEQIPRVQVTLASLQVGQRVKLSWSEVTITMERIMGNGNTMQFVERERSLLVLEED